MRYTVIDIETRPDPNLKDNKEYWTEVEEDLRPPSHYKDPAKIAAWRKERMETLVGQQALSPLTGSVCCYGRLLVDPCEASSVLVAVDEHENTLLKLIAAEIERGDVLVGFNLRHFDLPFLWARMAMHGIRSNLPAIRDYRRVGDLRDVLSEGPLYQWARAFGYPVARPDWSDLPSIETQRTKCEQDVAITAAIACRLEGSITALGGER